MSRDLSEIFVQEDRNAEFTRVEEEMILPISIENSVIFRFDEKIKNFDFDLDKDKAYEMVAGKITVEEFEDDIEELKKACLGSYPSGFLRTWVLSWAVAELVIVSTFLLVIWVILILDLVVLAAELYLFKKIKKIIWKWRKGKIDKVWVTQIEFSLQTFNIKYETCGICFKFDPDGKWIQLSTSKKLTNTLCN